MDGSDGCAEGLAAYVSTFVARHAGSSRPVRGVPGLHGVLPPDGPSPARLLVTDDRALDDLAALLPTLRAGRVTVLAGAPRCTGLLAGTPGWTSSSTTAMACPDLSAVPQVPLPGGLALRPVQAHADDAPGGVPLEDAVAVAVSADPAVVEPPEPLAAVLRSLLPAFGFLAAVDGDGVPQATSGVGVFGPWSAVIFVSTSAGWRRRGVGRAMTAAALDVARTAGARQACLDASSDGLPLYRGLGFEVVAPSTRFSGPA